MVDKEKKINRSKTYLFPLFESEVSIPYHKYVTNTYLRVCGENPYNDIERLFVLEVMDDIDEELLIPSKLENWEKYFIDHFKDDETRNIYMLFKFPSKYKEEYDLFLKGKYSKFSKESKKLIVRKSNYYYNRPEVTKSIIDVIFKSQERKDFLEKELGVKLDDDMELSSKPEIVCETLTFKI